MTAPARRPESTMTQRPPNSKIVVRLIAELPNDRSATAFAATIASKVTAFGDVLRVEAKRYWKIPEWFEVSLDLAPKVEVRIAFDGIVSILGEGWQRNDISNIEKWAVWNPGHGALFDSRARWGLVEAFPATD
jgi:hypothetical protein